MSNKKYMAINLISSIAVLFTNVIISFFLSPYIIKTIGVEANGFVTLANNFVTYATLAVSALNSMAARYITLDYVNNNIKEANIYYNSVFWGNLFIVGLFIIPATFFIVKMENIINVPVEILKDVKILFSFVFFNFFLLTGFPNWECGTYISNRLDRKNIPNIATSLFRCLFLFLILTVLKPRVWYVGFSASIVAIIGLTINGYNTHRLTPELRIDIKAKKELFSITAMKELVGSGIWNSISGLGYVLLTSIDLLVCNIFLGPKEMGIVSLSKILPNFMQQLSQAIRDSFEPELTIDYAKKDINILNNNISRAMKITTLLLTIPLSWIIVFGNSFFSLWVPSQNEFLLGRLVTVSVFGYVFTSGTQILYNVFPTFNKVKQNAIAMLISGAASLTISIFLLKFTKAGIYATVVASSLANIIRNISFTIPVTATYLGLKWNSFFKEIGVSIISTTTLSIIGVVIKHFFQIMNWQDLCISVLIIGSIGLIINIGVITSRNEKKYIIEKLKTVIGIS